MGVTIRELAQAVRSVSPSQAEALANVRAKIARLRETAPQSIALQRWLAVAEELEEPEYE